MAKPLITERAPAGTPVLYFAAASAEESDAVGQIPAAHRRSGPPPVPALDEATLRAHFADLAALAPTPWPGDAAAARAATLAGLSHLHPRQPAPTVQGALEVIHEVTRALAAITGLDRFSLQPPTLAAAERAALLVARASSQRLEPARIEVAAPAGSSVLAQAADLGLVPRPFARLESGDVDLESLDAAAGPATAAVAASWLTPSGAFERNLSGAAAVAHACGALFCVDATGLAALVGRTRLREADADIAWLSLRELCPAASGAALGVRSALTEKLPSPLVGKQRGGYELDDELPGTIGPLALAPADLASALAVYVALQVLGEEGLRERAERIVLQANALAREGQEGGRQGARRILLTTERST